MNKSIVESHSVKSAHFPFRPMLAARPSLLQIERKARKYSFLAEQPGQKPYTLVFENDNLPAGSSHVQAVKVTSIDEVQAYLFLLGGSCEMYVSPEYATANPDVFTVLKLTRPFSTRRKSSISEMDTAAALLRKLPMNLRGLLRSPLSVTDSDQLPEAIDRRYVHKKSSKNALISKPWANGKFLYFNMFDGIDEFRFDHESDHLQGMLILEAMRQASIAATHINGKLPLDGGMTLLSYSTMFYNYLENTSPVIIRAYSEFSWEGDEDERQSYAICQVFQWGKLCAEASLKACVFMSKEGYATHRIRSGRITERIKRQYATKLDLLKSQSVQS